MKLLKAFLAVIISVSMLVLCSCNEVENSIETNSGETESSLLVSEESNISSEESLSSTDSNESGKYADEGELKIRIFKNLN